MVTTFYESAELAARLLMGLFFMVAGAGKLANLREFKKIVLAYGIVRGRLASLLAYLLPTFEVVVAIGLLANFLRPFTEYMAGLLLLTFSSAVVVNLVEGRRELPCGCFGRDKENLSWHIVWRNLALLSLCLIAARKAVGVSFVLFGLFALSALTHRLSRKTKQNTLQSPL